MAWLSVGGVCKRTLQPRKNLSPANCIAPQACLYIQAPGTSAKLKVLEVTCGPLPCGAGGGGSVLATVDANGRFSVTLKLSDIVPTDRNYRVIAATPNERAGLATDPQVQIPLHSAAAPTGSGSTPGAPATGNSGSPNTDTLPFGAFILAALGLAAASASVLGLAAARRH